MVAGLRAVRAGGAGAGPAHQPAAQLPPGGGAAVQRPGLPLSPRLQDIQL